MFVLAVQLAHLGVHQVLDSVDLSLHLLLGGLQLVLQFTDERFTAAAVQRSLHHTENTNKTAHTTNMSSRFQNSWYTFAQVFSLSHKLFNIYYRVRARLCAGKMKRDDAKGSFG